MPTMFTKKHFSQIKKKSNTTEAFLLSISGYIFDCLTPACSDIDVVKSGSHESVAGKRVWHRKMVTSQVTSESLRWPLSVGS